jgi:hypothetical protein
LFYQETLFLGGSRRYVQEGSVSVGCLLGYLEVVSFTGDFERHEGGLWKRSVSLYWSWREGFFAGNSESYVRHVRERFGNGPLCLCRGSLRGPWGKRYYTEDSERHIMQGFGNGAYFDRVP